MLKKCKNKPTKLTYVKTAEYTPDFVFNKGKYTTYIEVKGRFRTSTEASKYIAVRESLTAYESLVFVFYDPDKPMPNAKARKDGTKLTHGEWARRHRFKYYTKETVPEEWST